VSAIEIGLAVVEMSKAAVPVRVGSAIEVAVIVAFTS